MSTPESQGLTLCGYLQLGIADSALNATGRNPALAVQIKAMLALCEQIRATDDLELGELRLSIPGPEGEQGRRDIIDSLEYIEDSPDTFRLSRFSALALHEVI